MSLESASYISGLNTSNPPVGDPVGNAADHLRLIKSVLKTSFPNINGVVSATDVQLSLSIVPVGGIIMYTGAVAPAGWGLCNGSTYTKIDGSGNLTSPNLVDKFIVGAGGSYALNATGGASTHNHNLWVGGSGLTAAQLPALSVVISDPGHTHGVYDPGHAHGNGSSNWTIRSQGGASNITLGQGSSTSTATTGIALYGAVTGISAYIPGLYGQTHSHTAGADVQSNLPPYFALAYIVKL